LINHIIIYCAISRRANFILCGWIQWVYHNKRLMFTMRFRRHAILGSKVNGSFKFGGFGNDLYVGHYH
jgi:hypothetical protein